MFGNLKLRNIKWPTLKNRATYTQICRQTHTTSVNSKRPSLAWKRN